jgi:hypothetical protein
LRRPPTFAGLLSSAIQKMRLILASKQISQEIGYGRFGFEVAVRFKINE